VSWVGDGPAMASTHLKHVCPQPVIAPASLGAQVQARGHRVGLTDNLVFVSTLEDRAEV
jgi:hypothetical protein